MSATPSGPHARHPDGAAQRAASQHGDGPHTRVGVAARHRDHPQGHLGSQAQQAQGTRAVLDRLPFGEHQFAQGRIGHMGRGRPRGSAVRQPGGDRHPLQYQVVQRARTARPFQPHPAGRHQRHRSGHLAGFARQGVSVRAEAHRAAVRQLQPRRALGETRGGPDQRRRTGGGSQQRLEVSDHPHRGGRVRIERRQAQQQPFLKTERE
ncbi:hypothetical protein [Streptomyces sp. NRRL S-813]|uniref:hypothetical protein n=1 Tax=Streptomyces sp. NRRL S-813 TaxID=1463919 RepID=UPI000AA66B51|nr:hypothetical protein [Streptomyces sp. NRRL S-813]